YTTATTGHLLRKVSANLPATLRPVPADGRSAPPAPEGPRTAPPLERLVHRPPTTAARKPRTGAPFTVHLHDGQLHLVASRRRAPSLRALLPLLRGVARHDAADP